MGNHIAEMESMLRKAFPGQSEDFYRYGRWGGGAVDSDAFKNLTQAERDAIRKYLKEIGLYFL